jgi:predicted Rossmann fold flavoprotein
VSDIVIVGAGAAGLATAIFARRFGANARVILLDGARTPGANILVSGGSRCNVTNRVVTERDFWGGSPATIRKVLRALPVDETVAFFLELGVPLHEEAYGKLFPDSNRSRDVLNALLDDLGRRGIELRADHRVSGLRRDGDRFIVETNHGAIIAPRVVLATGGRALPKSGSDGLGYTLASGLGHTIRDTTPALAPLVLAGDAQGMHSRLSGIAYDAELSIWIDGRRALALTGPLLWTHFGVSGPVALDASRHFARARLEGRSVTVTLNSCPGVSFDGMDQRLLQRAGERPRTTAASLVSEWLPAAVADAFVAHSGIAAGSLGSQLSRELRRALAHTLTGLPLPVADTRGYTYAEATAGGVRLDEINPATMESRVCPGLFLVGEVLDVDGRLGGFNFQWAWSSARVAGAALATARDASRKSHAGSEGPPT